MVAVEELGMTELAKLWTWIGEMFIPIAIVWAFYVRGGLPGKVPEGVLISWGYWGLLVTLAVGATLVFIAALYVREGNRTGSAAIRVPPNTMFGAEGAGNHLISRGTAIIFTLSVVGGLIVFGNRYLDSRIYQWDDTSSFGAGFWSSRASALQAGCGHGPCYAMAQRMYPGGPVSGVNEYVLYVTDGVLAILIVGLFCSVAFFIFVQAATARPRADR
jgi:hypothetical protein